MQLTLGFSPCPNDTFIFDALLHDQVETDGLRFLPVLEDVETLNRKAFNQELDITKLSFHTWMFLQAEYELLNSGSALGRGCGPLLISKNDIPLSEVKDLRVAIPGKYTTAHFLFQSRFGKSVQTLEKVFSGIENAVLSGEVDAGVIIHENRFTYQQRGLKKIIDLGEWWEQETGCAIPLGGIFIKKSLGPEIKKQVEQAIKKSVELGFMQLPHISDYIKSHSQEMDEMVMRQHIDLYVNSFSLDLGTEGNKAIAEMEKRFQQF